MSRNIRSTPLEIVGISCPDPQTGAYGRFNRSTGDVIQISEASNNDEHLKMC